MHYWIFKCRPTDGVEEGYRFSARMADPDPNTTWRVTRYQDEIRAGDVAFIWKTGKYRGIYAVMEIDENPRDMEEHYRENSYNVPPDYDVKLRVTGRLVKRLPGIPSAVLRGITGLEQLSVFHGFQQATNFPVSNEEGRIIISLIEKSDSQD